MSLGPLVSVNMAAYNAERYIAEAIQSVIAQSYLNWELIIINDSSTDNTSAEIAKFNDPRIKVFSNENNEGIVYTRNRALHYSTGKYIAVLDADDIYLPEKLKKQVGFLEKNNDYGLIGTGFRIIDADGIKSQEMRCLYSKAEYFPAILLFNNYFVHSSVMFRSELAKNILYKPLVKGYSPCEDYQLFWKLARTHKVYNISEELVYYRDHRVGISKLREDKIKEHVDSVIIHQLECLHIYPGEEELKLHKSIHYAFDNLDFGSIQNIRKWLLVLVKQNEKYKVYDDYFKQYLAWKWYEIARLNAEYGLKMLTLYFSVPLSRSKNITFNSKVLLIKRCLYEFKRSLLPN